MFSNKIYCIVLLALSTFALSSAFSPWGLTKQSRVVLFGEVKKEKIDVVYDTDFTGVDLGRIYGRDRLKRKMRRNEIRRSSTIDSSVNKAIRLIIAGAPASGKGTQCEIIKKKYGVVHLSTGDMLRAAVAAQTEVGKAAKEFMDSGKLVPDSVIIGVVKDRLALDDCKKSGWLLDGFPRTPAQAQALKEEGIIADCFLFLNVPDEILVERVVGRRTDPTTGKIYHLKFSPPESDEIAARLVQRSDDTEDKVKVRLEQFHSNVDAVKGFYTDIMVEIDGSMKPDMVSMKIEEAISSKITMR